MDYFELIPNENLEQICSQMDNRTLARFSQTYTRVGQACAMVIRNRRINLYHRLLDADVEFVKGDPEKRLKFEIFVNEERDGYYLHYTIKPKKNLTFNEIGLTPEEVAIEYPDPDLPITDKIETLGLKEVHRQYDLAPKFKEVKKSKLNRESVFNNLFQKIIEYLIDHEYEPNPRQLSEILEYLDPNWKDLLS